jgi:hypothetical protein
LNQLELTFNATESIGWPKLRFFINEDLIEDFQFKTNNATVVIPIDLIDGEYMLSVELYSKPESSTQYVELTDMCVDGIKLVDFYKWLGVYKFNNQVHPQALRWECNGVWEWKFCIPLLTYLLDKKIENEEKFTPPLMTNSERLAIERQKISVFEEQLNKI